MTTLAQIDLGESVQQGVTTVVAFVPKLLAFVAIVLIGWFVARVIQRVVGRLLERVGFDRAVERGGVKQALARTDYDASDLLAKIVFYAVMLFVLQLAFGVFGPNPISALLFGIIAFLPKIFVAIVIVVLAAAIAAAVRELIDAAIGSLSYGRMLANVAAAVIVAIGVFAALNQVEIAPAIVNGVFYALLAIVVGVAIVAVGGGGIVPMRARWENALARLDDESSRIREHAVAVPDEGGEPAHDDMTSGADDDERDELTIHVEDDDQDEITTELPTVPAPASATAEPAATGRRRRPTATLRNQLEEAGWPATENDDR